MLVLDGEGRRVFRVAKKGRTLEMIARLAAPSCSSLAPGPDGIAYAAYDRGILRARSRHAGHDRRRAAASRSRLERPAVDAAGTAGRWSRIQGAEVGRLRLVRLRLDDAGRRVRSVDVLDADVALAGPTSATLSGNTVFYLGVEWRR